MNTLNQIYTAQRDAGEAAVIANLERLGLIPKPKVSLAALIERADLVVCNGYEISSYSMGDEDDPEAFIKLECGDEVVAYVRDHEVTLRDSGEVHTLDHEGDNVIFVFMISRPMIASDL